MKNKEKVSIQIEYGEAELRQILIDLLKQQYINYLTMNEK